MIVHSKIFGVAGENPSWRFRSTEFLLEPPQGTPDRNMDEVVDVDIDGQSVDDVAAVATVEAWESA